METSISCNMTIPGKNARNCSYYGRKLIAEAAFSRSSGRQTRPCGLLMKGLRPLHTSRRYFVDSLKTARHVTCCTVFLVFFLTCQNPSDAGASVGAAFALMALMISAEFSTP